jgi:TPR repeat protein
MRWYRRAADQGNSQAQVNLGRLYERGMGVAKDNAQAIRWYGLAAGQGNTDAENNLRRLGQGTEKTQP